MKKTNGITLIALIITVIVMLILVSVTVSVVINSNLIGTAQNAANATKQAYENEGNDSEIRINGKTYESMADYEAGKYILPANAGKYYSAKGEYTDGKKTAQIPAKFTVSGARGEETIDGGLVIYLIDYKADAEGNKTTTRWTEEEIANINWEDPTTLATLRKTYDQFVWIPIKNTTDASAQDINDMYICQGKTSSNGACTIIVENGVAKCTNANHSVIVDDTLPEAEQVNKNTLMAGRLYANSLGEKFEQAYTETYTSGSGLREPDTVSGYDGNSTYLGYLSSILESDVAEANKEYTSINNFKEKLQDEYNEVVKSVYENQGFYVGRYETSGMSQSETTYDVAVVAGTLPSIETDWYHMYAQQKNYAKANSLTVGSTMIQGAAYDQVLKFVNTAKYSVTTVGNVGHSFSERYNTGSQSTDQSKNIFDLEGNVIAWTTEADSTVYRVSRGRWLRRQLFS